MNRYTAVLSNALTAVYGSTTALFDNLRARWKQLDWADDAGYVSETVLATAFLIVTALAVFAILAAKLLGKVNGIEL